MVVVGEPVLWHAVVVGSGGAVVVGLVDSVPALWCGRVGCPSEVSRGALRVLGLWGPGLWGPALGGAAHEARLQMQQGRRGWSAVVVSRWSSVQRKDYFLDEGVTWRVWDVCVCACACACVCVCVRALVGRGKNKTRSAYRLLLPSFLLLLLVGPGMVRGGRSRLRGPVISRRGVRLTGVQFSVEKDRWVRKDDCASTRGCDLWGSGLWGPALWGATGQSP